MELSGEYLRDVGTVSALLSVGESFDLIERRLLVGQDELTLFYIDGFVKDGVTQRLMQFYVGQKGLGGGEDAVRRFADSGIPYVEVEVVHDVGRMVTAVLSGVTLLLGSTFGAAAILVDSRTYPARPTEEPQSDRVMQGARDGFVDTHVTEEAMQKEYQSFHPRAKKKGN